MDFATQEGFVYTSPSTTRAKELVDLAVDQGHSAKIIRVAGNLLTEAQKLDMDLFALHGDYIKHRLIEIAWQRKFGTYMVWSEISVKNRADIDYAGQMLETVPK